MSIALYDDDFMRHVPSCFNLDLMKLSTYYKRKKEIVILAPTLEPERYEKVFFAKDFNDKYFDKKILYDNVEYMGHAFSGDRYHSLPEEIQLCEPDTEMYLKFERKYQSSQKLHDTFKKMRNTEHFRLSLDGKTIWQDFDKVIDLKKKTQSVFLHDYDINKIKDSDLALKEIINQMTDTPTGQRFGVKFPIQVSDEQEILKWAQFKPLSISASFQFNGFMSDELFYDFITKNTSYFQGERFYYDITYGAKDEQEVIEKRLLPVFCQILFSKSLRKKMLLKYKNNFFKDRRWEEIIDLFNGYLNGKSEKSKYRNTYTFFRYIQGKIRSVSRGIIDLKKKKIDYYSDLFLLVREKNYDLFALFYTSYSAEYRDGKIEPIIQGG